MSSTCSALKLFIFQLSSIIQSMPTAKTCPFYQCYFLRKKNTRNSFSVFLFNMSAEQSQEFNKMEYSQIFQLVLFYVISFVGVPSFGRWSHKFFFMLWIMVLCVERVRINKYVLLSVIQIHQLKYTSLQVGCKWKDHQNVMEMM